MAAIAMLALASGGGRAKGQAFGQAAGYTEFIFGNSTRSGDTTGSVAIGGNADFKTNGSFTVENDAKTTNTLVVGGTLTGQYGTIGQNYQSGNSYVGGNLNFSDPSIYGKVSVNGNVNLSAYGNIYGNLTYHGSYTNPNTGVTGTLTHSVSPIASPINFSTEQTILSSLSTAQYKASDAAVTYDAGGHHLTFNASGSGTTYLNISGSILAGADGITIHGSANQTVVVNVSGTSDLLPNVGYTLSGGITVDHVLYNFFQATSLTVSSDEGSVLAPFASVTALSGGFNGELIASSMTGSVETHVYDGGGGGGQLTPFDGNLRPVPEPASLALMGAGGLGLLGFSWRRRRLRGAS